MSTKVIITVLVMLFLLIVLPMALKVFQEYERGVIFRLGKPKRVSRPGLFFVVPFIERVYKVDMRIIPLELPVQEAINRDHITVQAKAVVKFKVTDPMAAIIGAKDYTRMVEKVCKDQVQKLLTQSEGSQPNFSDTAGRTLQKNINQEIMNWGLEVTEVKLENIEFGQLNKLNWKYSPAGSPDTLVATNVYLYSSQ